MNAAIEAAAIAMWQEESLRVGRGLRQIQWEDENAETRAKWVGLARAAIIAFLRKCEMHKKLSQIEMIIDGAHEISCATTLEVPFTCDCDMPKAALLISELQLATELEWK